MADLENLTAETVAEWLRAQARKFAEMAESVESAFATRNGKVTSTASEVQDSVPPPKNSERMKALLSDGRARRPAEMAIELGLNETLVRKIVANRNDLFSINERGWITVR